MAASHLDIQRAESAQQHVRALNSQFASWVQSQLQNHPDELWQDGVEDYLSHASQIMEKFRDVVEWLKVNAEKADNMAAVAPVEAKKFIAEAKTKEASFPLNNGKSGFPPFGGSIASAFPTFGGSSSSGLSFIAGSSSSGLSSIAGSSSSGLSSIAGSSASFTNLWSFGIMPSNQTAILPGGQSLSTVKPDASEDQDGENDVEQPSSPSLKKSEEKGIIVVHEAKCKVYMKPDNPAEKGWKDMGVGQLSLKCQEGAAKASKDSKPTVVVRNDVGRVLLNALLYAGIKMNVQKNTVTTIFHTLGTGNANGTDGSQDTVVKARTYLLKLRTEEDTNKLAEAIKEYAPVA